MKEKKGGELICKRPETIVEARFSLTKKQNDIMDMVFTSIADDEKLDYEIDVSKYAKLYKLKNKSNVYSDCKKATKSFEGKGFRILNKENKREDYFPWFSRITYLDGESKIQVELGKTLKQLFLDVKRACFYNIEYTLNFKSIYGQRLYYYLKTFEDTGFRVDNLEELKKKLVCPSSYKNFSDFKRFVMVPAYEDINGNSDMSFEYESIKTGRKVTTLKFYIKKNKITKLLGVKDEVSATVEEEEDVLPNMIGDVPEIATALESAENNNIKKVMEIMKEHNIKPLDAKKILTAAAGDINKIKEKYVMAQKTSGIGNFLGWMLKALKDDYKSVEGKDNLGSWNDIEQRPLDPSLEWALLGWDKVKKDDTGEESKRADLIRRLNENATS